MSDTLPKSYDFWRTSSPPEQRLSTTLIHCDCGCGEAVNVGDVIYVTHDGERVLVEHFAEYAEQVLVMRKETISE